MSVEHYLYDPFQTYLFSNKFIDIYTVIYIPKDTVAYRVASKSSSSYSA